MIDYIFINKTYFFQIWDVVYLCNNHTHLIRWGFNYVIIKINGSQFDFNYKDCELQNKKKM